MAKFKVVLERTDTITKQAELMVEATSAEHGHEFFGRLSEAFGRTLSKIR